MDRKMNYPDSDESARKSHPAKGDEDTAESTAEILNAQTSNKSGKHSTAEKLSASRPEFGEGRGAQPVDGAFGRDEEGEHIVTGRLAGPDANQFRCESCGRYFKTSGELSEHEVECRTAKAATSAGRS
ncbi:MAG: hypothetical protein ACR2IV_15270 [Bryobacteraceae bacterium]